MEWGETRFSQSAFFGLWQKENRLFLQCQDNHLRVDSHDFSFKGHVKNRRIYIDAALSVVKHIDHIRHSVYLKIEELVLSAISSWWKSQLMYSFVLFVGLLQLLGHWCQLWSYAQAAKSSKPRSEGCFCDHEHVKSLFKSLYWLPVKDRIIFKMATSVFHFFDGIWPPYLSSCLFSSPVCSSSDEKNLPCAWWNLEGLVISHSVFRLPLCGTTFLLTSNTAVLSHSSEFLLKPFSSAYSKLL